MTQRTTTFPTLVSFWAGDKYYRDAAERLRADCDALRIPHDIVELELAGQNTWSSICRRKIPFYADMLARHPDGILWVDVDTRIVKYPALFENAGYDLAAFLRHFYDLRQYDPVQSARTFHPGFLHFNGTEKTRAFVAHLAQLEKNSTLDATDDYFLEEGWSSFGQNLALMLMPADLLVRDPGLVGPNTCFLFGTSGNVPVFKDTVEQHKAQVFEAERQAAVLWKLADTVHADRPDDAAVLLRYARDLAPANTRVALALASAKLKLREWDEAERIVQEAFGNRDIDDPGANRILATTAMRRREWSAALQHLDAMEGSADHGHLDFVRLRRFHIGLEMRAENMGVSARDRPQLWWMEHSGNFGDMLNPYVVEKLSGVPPRRAKQGEGILAIGSVIKFARKGTQVWGTGTPRMTDTLAPDAEYRAVRGPLTRELVLRSGGGVPAIYGDPALLLPLLYKPKPRPRTKLGLVRHIAHRDRNITIEGAREISVLRIDYDEIEAFIDEVCSCDAILSSSLHGLIVAHAYGVPARWCDFADAGPGIPGDTTKFADHFAAVGIESPAPLDLSSIDRIDISLAGQCHEVMTRTFDSGALLSVAPFPIRAVT